MKGEQLLELGYSSVSVEAAGSGLCSSSLPPAPLHAYNQLCGCTSFLEMSSLFLSGTELSVIMSLSKDYISLRWFLRWENYASLNWNVFRELLCMCFLTHNAEGDLFASLIGQHLLGLEEKHFLSFQCHNLHFFWSPFCLLQALCRSGLPRRRHQAHSLGASGEGSAEFWCILAKRKKKSYMCQWYC